MLHISNIYIIYPSLSHKQFEEDNFVIKTKLKLIETKKKN